MSGWFGGGSGRGGNGNGSPPRPPTSAPTATETQRATSTAPPPPPQTPPAPTFTQGLREATAGVLGYMRANLVGAPPASHQYSTPERQDFDQQLQSRDIPPILQRQLRSQNYMQDLWNNPLPPQAAAAMIQGAENVSAAARTGDRMQTASAHFHYMRDSIAPFEDGGSSWGPRVMHNAGVLVQTPTAVSPNHFLRQPRSFLERIGATPPSSGGGSTEG